MNTALALSLWSSLPIPALLIDASDNIADMNPAAEGFMNNSAKWITGQPIWDRLAVDAPIEESFAKARANGTPLFVNDVDVGTGSRPPRICSLHISPLQGQMDWMIVLVSPRELAGRMTQNNSVKAAAKSAIGMAEMLAHEIKNPLAGIAGAAQLLSMGLSKDDLELTDLIVSETRRIVKLLEQVEQFGNLSAPERKPVNIHDVLDRARRSALLGFGAHMTMIEDYDPSLPLAHGDPDQLLQVVLNLLKNASEAADQKEGAGSACTPSTSTASSCAARTAPARRCPCRSRSSMTGRACPRISGATCSSRLFRDAKTARGSASRSSRRSYPTMTAGFPSTACRGGPCSASRCRWRPKTRRRMSDGWHGTGCR